MEKKSEKNVQLLNCIERVVGRPTNNLPSSLAFDRGKCVPTPRDLLLSLAAKTTCIFLVRCRILYRQSTRLGLLLTQVQKKYEAQKEKHADRGN